MGQRGKFRTMSDSIAFFCIGCNELHIIRISGIDPWEFNGDYDRPTFKPSIKVSGKEWPTDEQCKALGRGEKINLKDHICHSYVTNGQIEYLSDSTHHLKGQTVDIPELPEWLTDED